MLTRRLFLANALWLATGQILGQPAAARKRQAQPLRSGPRIVARQDWPPSIVPDHIAAGDRGLVFLTDEFGRLATAEFRKGAQPRVLGELKGVGKRIIDFCPIGQRAYAISLKDSAAGDSEYILAQLSLAPLPEPSLMNELLLDQFSEVACLAVGADIITVGGVAHGGANLLAVYRRVKSSLPSLISTFTTDATIIDIDLQDRHLAILGSNKGTQLDYANLYDPHAPQIRRSLRLEGSFNIMARQRDQLVVCGQPAKGAAAEVKLVALEPQPRVLETRSLGGNTAVLDAAAQKGKYFILYESGSERLLAVLSLTKALTLKLDATVTLPQGRAAPGRTSRLAVREKSAYVASGWGGIEQIGMEKTGWRHLASLSIPRLPASGVAVWDNLAALSASDLELYDMSRPDRPALSSVTEPAQPVKCLVGAGSFILCLSSNSLSLRKMDNIQETISTVSVSGQHIAYDRARQKAYIVTSRDKDALVTPVRVYSNKLVVEAAITLNQPFRRVSAHDDRLALESVNDVALVRLSQTKAETIGSRHFEHLAMRDLAIAGDYLAVTAVNRQSRGNLLILSAREKDLRPLSVLDLPNDATALAVAGERLVVVGRAPDGSDITTVVSISNPERPTIVASLPAVEQASAVAIRDNLAIVVGRGLAVYNIT